MSDWGGFGFDGRTALVTGAGGGMGLQIARELAAAGAAVTGIDLKDPPDGFPGIYARGDITDWLFLEATIGEMVGRTGRFDLLANVAGVLAFGIDTSLAEIELATWNRMIEINLTGSMLAARFALTRMRAAGNGGAMVHFSSTQCLRGDDKPQDAYQVAKAGIIAMSKSLAIQGAADGIRSNTVIPGPTATPMQARWQEDPQQRRATATAVPLGRVGEPADLANAALFLLSGKASWITGTELLVDGGLMAKP
jgi:NAD(P)-dependent dehydrogenase (short-subunit alcohol dehydrogenase family)